MTNANPSQSEIPDPAYTLQQSPQSLNPISFDPQILEISTIQNPRKPDPTRSVADQEEEEEKESSGMVQESAIKSPNYRRFSKRQKAIVQKKQLTIDKKVQNLLQLGTLKSFVPPKRFDFDKHAELFKRLGLWDFVHIEFDDVIRDDLVGQFIVSYDHIKKFCCVNGFRISVNRSRFATVLKLPVKKDKAVSGVAEAGIDLEVEQISEECVEFLHDFVWSWVVLRGDDWVTPDEVKGWSGLIRDGNVEKVDWASLLWAMVENELKQRDQLRMCYYASHLQYFIKSQRKGLFEEDGEGIAVNEEMKEEENTLGEEEMNEVVEEMKKDVDLLEAVEKGDEKEVMHDRDFLRERPQEVDEKEVKKVLNGVEVEDLKEGPPEEAVQVEGVKKDVVSSFYDCGKDPDKFVVEEPITGLTFGHQYIVQKEEIKDYTRMAGEECPEKKNHDRQFDFAHDTEDKHFLKPCLSGEGRGSNGKEEIKQEAGQLEMKEEEHMGKGEWIHGREHMVAEDVEELEGHEMWEQLEDEEEEELEDEDEEEEELEDEEEEEVELEDEEEDELGEEEELEEEPLDAIGCNIAPNYGSVERDDLTGNLVQGFEAAHSPLNLQGQQLRENSSIEHFASSVNTQVMMGCPSIFGNGHKRVFDYEQNTSHLDGSKRIRTDGGWDQNTSDFRSCMDQARQYMEKSKLIYEEKSQAYNQLNASQQNLLQELQLRDRVIKNLQRNKNEELQKKDGEIYRLERELDLLGELVTGYREALKVNRNMFFEYRQRCKLPEEPIYRDAGSGGLVLSTTELEKQRQQQENEDRLKRLMIEQKFTEAFEGYVNQFQVLFSKVQMLDMNRLTPVVNEVKQLKVLCEARRRAPEIPDFVPSEMKLTSA